MKDKKLILSALKLINNHYVVDLGAGDGAVIFEAAYDAFRKKTSTVFIALELNPILVLILHIRRLLHPNRRNIKIVWGDMFKFDYQQFRNKFQHPITYYLYISPWLIEKTVKRILKQTPSSRFVSYYYPIKSLKKRERQVKGIHPLYTYE